MEIPPLLVSDVLPYINPAISATQIDYPAAVFPMHTSVSQGVTTCTDLIVANNNGSNPETNQPFMLIGYSQGAILTSEIFKAYSVAGGLPAPNANCLGGWTFGNPERYSGSYVGNNPGGEGILGSGYVMTQTYPTLWTDYADPGDLFTSNSDLAVSVIASAAYNLWGGNPTNLDTIIEEWIELLENAPLKQLVIAFEELVAFAEADPQPHTEYDVSPSLFGTPESAAELCYTAINAAYETWLTGWNLTYG